MQTAPWPSRRLVRCVAIVAVFVLALSLTSIALAATPKYTNVTPAPGSSTTNAQPTVRVTVYDAYGSYGKGTKRMWVDGAEVSVKVVYDTAVSNHKKFTVTYRPATALKVGSHPVTVRIKDNRGNVHYYRWSFSTKTGDTVAPVTTSDAQPEYAGMATVHLTATDNVGVTATYYKLDLGPQMAGTTVVVSTPGLHWLEFWSVDAAGNTEVHTTRVFNITPFVSDFVHPKPAASVSTCVAAGCHAGIDVATLHLDAPDGCGTCHAGDAPAISDCDECHTTLPEGHDPESHAAIPSVPAEPAENCEQADCHGDAGAVALHADCAVCHNSGDEDIDAIIDAGGATCESCHDIDTVHGFVHAKPVNSCTVAGCHFDTDVAAIHAEVGCAVCHGEGITPSNDCVACHGATPPGHTSEDHAAIPSEPIDPAEGCTQAICHGDAPALSFHDDDCAVCHDSGDEDIDAVVAAGDATCEDCHSYAEIHVIPEGAHAVSGACYSSGCHPSDVADIHTTWATPPGCFVCHGEGITPSKNCDDCHDNISTVHDYVHPSAAGELSTGCTVAECHGSTDVLAIVPGHTDCSCHSYASEHLNEVIAAGIEGPPAECLDCHAGEHAPHQDAHDAIDKTDSAVCISCHTDDYYAVGSRESEYGEVHVPAVPTDPVQEHKGCSCHEYGEAEAPNECVDCHAPHGFSQAVAPWDPTGTWIPAGGHNTPLYGVKGGTEEFGEAGVVIKSDKDTTIEQEWPLPTASVFWSQSNLGSLSPTDSPLVAMDHRGFASAAEGAAAINTEVGWGSVITCYDCHTELEGLEGPQGANAANFGLDPNFPDDWTKAEITSFDPTGMRKIDTVRDTPNPYYPKLNAAVYMPAEVENPADPANPWAGMSIETTQKPVFGAGMGSNPATVTVYPGGFYAVTRLPSNGYSMGDSTGRFICQKCHKLTNSFQGLGIEGNGRGARDNALNYMGMSNEAHMEHHNDMVTGQANCVSCHIAIPHGWKRPRLLVYESDPAPYKVQHVWPQYRSTDTAVLRNMAPTNLYSDGNWGFLSNPNAGTNNRYQDLTGTNAFTGGPVSSHLEKLDASTSALKELAVGPAHEFHSYDASNTASIAPYTGFGVNWGDWEMDAEGVEWHGNTEGYFISATAWDGETNSPITISEYPIQNQCNACTSASAGTHAPQVGTNTGGEGVDPALPAWK